MTVCNYDGDYRFVDGSPTLVGKGVTSLTDPYDPSLSVGFTDNDSSTLDDLPASGTSTGMSVSMWINLNKDNEFGLTDTVAGDPTDGVELLSLDTGILSDTITMPWYIKLGGTLVTFGGHGAGLSNIFACYIADSNMTGATVVNDVYKDLLNMGWFHIFASVRMRNAPTANDANVFSYVYINDDLVWHVQEIDANQVGTTFNQMKIATGSVGNGASLGRRCSSSYAMSECWVINEFIDWSKESNRYKFHKYENGLYKAIDIGATGMRPGFGEPSLYFTGGPDVVNKNRTATGGSATVTGIAFQSVSSSPF